MILLREHKEVLMRYIDAFPNSWKVAIRKEWDSPFCLAPLRVLRNTYGPTWLSKLTANKVRSARVR